MVLIEASTYRHTSAEPSTINMCSIRIHCSQPLLLEKQRRPLAHRPHLIQLAIISQCSHFWPASNYPLENKTLLLSIYAKTIVLPLLCQKLWQIIPSLCLKGTRAGVKYYYSEGLHKQTLTHTPTKVTGPTGIYELARKANIASVIMNQGNHNSVHTTEECKNKGAIQQQKHPRCFHSDGHLVS